jgi:hypothetical protein
MFCRRPSGVLAAGMVTGSLNPTLGAAASDNPKALGDYPAAPLPTDQREVSRPQGPHCDIGAFELAVVPTPTAPPASVPSPPSTGHRPAANTAWLSAARVAVTLGGLMLLGVAVQVWRRGSNGVGGRRESQTTSRPRGRPGRTRNGAARAYRLSDLDTVALAAKLSGWPPSPVGDSAVIRSGGQYERLRKGGGTRSG